MSACRSTFILCKRSPSISQVFIILVLTTVMTFILAVLQD
ncbi:hypothetical protein T03_13877 [Trichinella britovi]|uniref:Uncharacterized protein n=1 Tax=Trichinella britovi TaxID=45882 RepID=A0A0V1CNQ2_TRIBR|nr:hypothetical protein T03_13877 [Trichinella britovi]